jgi:Zn-dependent M28 family amino/carboxypeptidase
MDQAVLVNAHFDSVAGSPGASDDGIGVAVMLEATRSLVMGEALKKPVVMLFNGAEESNHHAAHGFITQHKWAKSIKYLINLEAIGAGGREMVFQCNSGELMALYGKTVPFPHAHAVAHELFKHIIWRAASTDWLTILKHGSPGMYSVEFLL